MATALNLRTIDGAIVQPIGVGHVDVHYGAQLAVLPINIRKEKNRPY